MNTMFEENEYLVKEGKANYFTGQTSAGGKLYLTNKRLIFEGGMFNIGNNATMIRLEKISMVNVSFPNILTIVANDGERDCKFAVNGKNDWSYEIKNQIEMLKTKPASSNSNNYRSQNNQPLFKDDAPKAPDNNYYDFEENNNKSNSKKFANNYRSQNNQPLFKDDAPKAPDNNYYDFEENNNKSNSKKFVVIAIVAVIVIGVWGVGKIKSSCLFGHEFKAATCEKAPTCSKCGETEGKPLGHEFKAATCKETKVCTRCRIHEGSPLGHSLSGEEIIDIKPTCSKTGKSHQVCTTCGENVEKSLPKLEHKLGEWEIETVATVSSSGKKVQKCTLCGEVINSDTYDVSPEEKAAAEAATREKEVEQYTASCKVYNYNDILRNPSSYVGEKAKFVGKVLQVQKNGNTFDMLVNVTDNGYGLYSDTIYVHFVKRPQDNGIIEDDIITIYGELNSTKTYTTVLGAEKTVPAVNAAYVGFGVY